MAPRASLLAVLAALVLVAAACGGNGSKVEVLRLRSQNPLTSNIYIRVKGPSGAVNYVVQRLETGAFTQEKVAGFVPPARRHRRALCSLTHTIASADAPDLQQWSGKKVRLTLYGDAGIFCETLRSAGIYQASS